MNLLVYCWLVFKSSLFSFSGLGNLPMLYADLLNLGWATEQQFAEALTISKISPGPTGLWVICLSYLIAGLPGALLSVIAISIPPLLALLLARVYQRIGQHHAMRGFIHGMALGAVGIFLVAMAEVWHSSGVHLASVVMVIASVLLALSRLLHPVVILALAAVVAVVWS
ncbi:MAG: chromate transporter [Chloroflexaceae bacterium]|nr:chromate transporter [Chloroflexaceae bacterium]